MRHELGFHLTSKDEPEGHWFLQGLQSSLKQSQSLRPDEGNPRLQLPSAVWHETIFSGENNMMLESIIPTNTLSEYYTYIKTTRKPLLLLS